MESYSKESHFLEATKQICYSWPDASGLLLPWSFRQTAQPDLKKVCLDAACLELGAAWGLEVGGKESENSLLNAAADGFQSGLSPTTGKC